SATSWRRPHDRLQALVLVAAPARRHRRGHLRRRAAVRRRHPMTAQPTLFLTEELWGVLATPWVVVAPPFMVSRTGPSLGSRVGSKARWRWRRSVRWWLLGARR